MVAKLWSLQAYASETSNQSDWTGWRGPDQTNISPDTGLLKSWPKGGPKLLWTYEDAGSGYPRGAKGVWKLYTLGASDSQ